MANYETLKTAIQQVVKTNGNNEITGALLQQSLLAIINSLGDGYQFVGIANLTTNPGIPDAKVFYIASVPGVYPNFGIIAPEGKLSIFYYDEQWHLSTITPQIQQTIIEGNVTNMPDNEDLTTITKGGIPVLQFKDRDVENGKGYIILRKGKTFAEQITQANTIYEIRYDFNLQGQTQSVPSDCVLYFTGGVISNGIILGNNTTIVGAEYGAFDGVRLSGIFTNIESNLSWWGCVPFNVDNQYDNASKIEDAFKSSISRVGVSGIYGVSKPIDISCSVVGISDKPGYKFCGFYANSDFSPITITLPRDNESYEVNGLFYHYYDEHPSIENITIDLRYCAKYAIEHIAGYSNIEILNVNIYNALVAGVLQYGCEKMTWNTLLTKECRYGAIISTHKIDEDNPFSATTDMGSPNMVVLENCSFIGGNYGLICRGGSNYKLDSCETAYNSLFGLILLGSSYLLLNYYSEGDCFCNFWINNNGIKSYPNSDGGTTEVVGEWDKGKTHPYLIENNIDGILCKNGSILESSPYMRSIIYVERSKVTFVGSFLSIKPRSYNISDIQIDARELPTERNASGVDALIISGTECSIILRNIAAYSLANDIGTMAFTDIVMKATDYGDYSTESTTNVSCDGQYQVRLWYDDFNNRFTNFNDCRIVHSVNDSRITNKGLIDIKPSNSAYADLNSDQDLWQYGIDVITPYKHNSLKGYVKNVPIYKRDTSRPSYHILNFTKAQVLSKFGDRMQIKCKFVAYIPEDVTSKITLSVTFWDSADSVISSYSSDPAGDALIKAGYYESTIILPLKPKESKFDDWARTLFAIYVANESTIDVYISNIYFFDIGDSSELCDNKIPILVSGATDIRPYLPFIGQSYFDTTLSKSIIWTGTKWVDTTGADA